MGWRSYEKVKQKAGLAPAFFVFVTGSNPKNDGPKPIIVMADYDPPSPKPFGNAFHFERLRGKPAMTVSGMGYDW